MSISFDVSTVSAVTSTSFDHGVEYPAQIVGIFSASKEFQGQFKSGVALLVLIKDNNDKFVYRSLFMSLEGYVLGSRATYAKVMQGLLRCADTDAALQEKIIKSGINDLRSLVGRPCLARMTVREKDGKSWANIDALVGETARSKGIDPSETGSLSPVDIQRICGKFVKIPNLNDCLTVEGLKVESEAKSASDGLEEYLRPEVEANVF